MSLPLDMTGGDKLMDYLNNIIVRTQTAGANPEVRVGFLEGATYPDGTSVALVAATQEFGGTVKVEAGETTIYRKTNAAGTTFVKNGRFVKKDQSNFASTHETPAHTITIPPRPFFRTMIKAQAPTWGEKMGKVLVAAGFNAETTLGRMGKLIKGQLQQSIVALTSPPLAAATIARKGSSKPLVDTRHMLDSVDFEVST